MSKQHTPAEWSCYPHVSGLMNVIRNGRIIFQTSSLDVAEHTVKACNNHDRLVEALYEANNQARRLLNRYDPNNIDEMDRVNNRAKYLAENFGNNNEPKIIQS